MPDHRHLPHLRSYSRQPVIFLTVVTNERRPWLAGRVALDALTKIWQRSPGCDGWFVGDFFLMPDHLHLFAQPSAEAKTLARWVGTWKSIGSRTLAPILGLNPPLWQRDYFDRFLRSADNYREKRDYVTLNPVRQGLCPTPLDWPWKGRLHELHV
ncbi:MAG: transposase [Opitutae bacterium]|nr:transposase [Opitutae bacterium]